MLHNTSSFLSPLETNLIQLERSSFDFHLTGSRFFGGARNESDWDFITEYTNSVEEFLLQSGFVLNTAVEDYLDPMTTKVLTKYFCGCEVVAKEYGERVVHGDACQKIDIQLCHDTLTKLKVRNILKKGFQNQSLPGDKYQRSRLWSMVYELVKNEAWAVSQINP